MDPGQQLARVLTATACRTLASPVVDVPVLQSAVALPAIGHDGCARCYVLGHKRVEGGRRRIIDWLDPTATQTLGLSQLYGYASQDLLALGSAARKSWFFTADVGLIDLDGPAQLLPSRTHQNRSESVQHGPCCRIGADLQSPFHAEGRDTILACGKQPGGGKPHRERRARPVEDCSGCDGGPTLAPGAHESTVAQPPAPMMPAGRAHEPGRPPQPLQVVQAVRISSEPSLKFTHRPWVVRACPRMTHRATLHELRLNEYPQSFKCFLRRWPGNSLRSSCGDPRVMSLKAVASWSIMRVLGQEPRAVMVSPGKAGGFSCEPLKAA